MDRALQRWRNVLNRVFPEDARIIMPPVRDPQEAGQWRVLISWRLRGDPARPYKRSKVVQIIVAGKTLEDYTQCTSVARLAADLRLESELRERLAQFDAGHDTPAGREPPQVTWRIGEATPACR